MKLNLFWVPVTVTILMAGCATQHAIMAGGVVRNEPRSIFLKSKLKVGSERLPHLTPSGLLRPLPMNLLWPPQWRWR